MLLPVLYTLNLPHETRHTHIDEVIEIVFTMWYNCVYIATVPHVQGTFANVMSIQHPWGRGGGFGQEKGGTVPYLQSSVNGMIHNMQPKPLPTPTSYQDNP